MTTEAVDVQLAPLWSGRTMSEEAEAKLEAMAAEADARREATLAREAELLAASGAIPGSLADLQAVTTSRDQAPFSRWLERNAQLVEQVASGAVSCCGEWQRDGYHGWCSLLTRPNYLVRVGERELSETMRVPVYERCTRCPRAQQVALDGAANEQWIESFFSFLEALEHGDSPFADVRS